MNDPGHQLLWRESLRKSNNQTVIHNTTTCHKLARHNIQTLITSKLKNSNLFKLKSKFQAKTNSLKVQNDYSKIKTSQKEILNHYEKILKQQSKDLSQISLENQMIEKKILELKLASNVDIKLDTDEKVINYYKTSIKAAENLLSRMKKEFYQKSLMLSKEKSTLEAEISFKGIKLN